MGAVVALGDAEMKKLTDGEIDLRQALVAVLCAARDLGCDVDEVAEKASTGILSNRYRIAEHPHVMGSKNAVDDAVAIARTLWVAKE